MAVWQNLYQAICLSWTREPVYKYIHFLETHSFVSAIVTHTKGKKITYFYGWRKKKEMYNTETYIELKQCAGIYAIHLSEMLEIWQQFIAENVW